MLCENPNNLFASAESNEAYGSQSCWTIHNIYTPPWVHWSDRSLKMPQVVRAAAGEMSVHNITYPQDFLAVEFNRGEKSGRVTAVYLFDPEAEGIRSNEASSFETSDWASSAIGRYPDKLAYVNRLKDWGRVWWPHFKDGFAQLL